jgi:hypothetical protein
MWLPVILTLAAVTSLLLAGAAWRSLSLGHDRAARVCARGGVICAMLALALGALWLSAAIFWPLEAAHREDLSESSHSLLREPLIAIVGCAGLAFVSLPLAALVLRAVTRRTTSARLRAELATQDEQFVTPRPKSK